MSERNRYSLLLYQLSVWKVFFIFFVFNKENHPSNVPHPPSSSSSSVDHFLSLTECKRKALKLNFANPPVKPASRLPSTPHPPPSRTPTCEYGAENFSEQHCDFTAEDLRDLEIGRGRTAPSTRWSHKPTGQIMLSKDSLHGDEKEQKQLMDLDVVMRSSDCPYIQFYGALFREVRLKISDCWICMELMSTSLDKFYKYVYFSSDDVIPEKFRNITLATVKALNHLKENLKIIHRGKTSHFHKNNRVVPLTDQQVHQGSLADFLSPLCRFNSSSIQRTTLLFVHLQNKSTTLLFVHLQNKRTTLQFVHLQNKSITLLFVHLQNKRTTLQFVHLHNKSITLLFVHLQIKNHTSLSAFKIKHHILHVYKRKLKFTEQRIKY
uniref:Uncharacterized protein n=1 Tax=Labrus bergylta TaxID=56723 RepID=A0A3Q3H2F0_9LABR